jgi:polysaccharide biosynthesis protein PslH
MRILYITNGFPWPLTSGFLRHYHFVRRLAPRHEVTLLSIVGGDFRQEHIEGLEPYTSAIQTFRSTGRSRSPWRKATRRLADWTFAGGAEAAGRNLATAVDALVRERPPDVVFLSGRRTDPVLDRIRGLPLVVDMCDATSSRLVGGLPYAAPTRRPLLRVELARVRAVEKKLMRAGDRLLFASQRDLELLADGASSSRCVVVPNGVELDYWSRRTDELGSNEVVFSGAMHYPPNADAAGFLIDRIMPRVWEREPNVRLTVVGRDPGADLVRRGADPRVTVTGFVEDVRPHLESAAVYAAPLRFAAGIQNKLLEAMAMELPIVTSGVAAAGLRTAERDDPPVTIADEPDDVAAAILEALARTRADRRPIAEARRYVAEHFDWDRAADDLDQALGGARSGR